MEKEEARKKTEMVPVTLDVLILKTRRGTGSRSRVGANRAVFSVVNTVLLRPLAYRAADRIVDVFQLR
jgi:hypothetical protein